MFIRSLFLLGEAEVKTKHLYLQSNCKGKASCEHLAWNVLVKRVNR